MNCDFPMLERLHAIPNDPNASAEQKAEARATIASIEDEVVEGYLDSLLCEQGVRKGCRRLESFEVLWARNVIEGPTIGEGGKMESNPPLEDKIGNVLFHRRYSETNT